MSFLYPWVFLLLPLALWGVFRRAREEQGAKVASLSQWETLRCGRARYLWVLRGLQMCFFLGLLAAMARPQMSSTRTVDEAEGIAIELLLDVSSSMDRTVILPDGEQKTRMEVAKELLEQFIVGDGGDLTGRANDLIGLITFARYADTRSPLTFGHEALVQIVRNVEIQDRPNEDGTAYGDALAIGSARLKGLEDLRTKDSSRKLSEIESRIVVLLTDGENNSGSHLPLEAAGLAKQWGVKVYSITLGDPEDLYGKNRDISRSELTASEQTLQRISEETGGVFRRATGYESLRSIYEEIDGLETSRIETRSFSVISEVYWIPLLIAFCVLGMWVLLNSTWLRVAE